MREALVFSLLCGSLHAAPVGGAININSGYRFDSISLKSTPLGVEREDKITDLKGWQNTVDGTLKIGSFFLCGSAAYHKIFKKPEYYTILAGTKEPTQFLNKRYGFSGSGRFGYLFELCSGALFLGPEVGYSFQRLNTDHNAYEIAASPFAGFQLVWSLFCDWSINLNVDFHLLGERRSRFVSETFFPVEKTAKGKYYGPEVRLACDYSITSHWSMGTVAFFKLIKTWKCELPDYDTNTVQTWMSGGASLSLGYTF